MRQEDLLIPRPRHPWEGRLVTFVAVALFLHALGYVWISKYVSQVYRKRGSLVHVQMLNEIPPPKPKLKPPPKPKLIQRVKPQSVAPLLHVEQVKFHEPRKSPASKEPSNLTSIEEPKGGSASGNPGGSPEGKGHIDGTLPTPLPPPPPPKLLVPDRKNPAVLNRCQPLYPEMERDQGIEGTVGILVVVGRRGEIVDASVAQSSGNSALDSVALSNVRQCWKFAPAVQNGEPVEARLTFNIVFRLQ